MQIFQGTVLSDGWAMGVIRFWQRYSPVVSQRKVTDIKEEKRRYDEAKKRVSEQLEQLYDQAVKEVGALNAEEFEVQRHLLNHSEYSQIVLHILTTQEVNAEYAVAEAGRNMEAMFEQAANENLRMKTKDIREVTARLVDSFFTQETQSKPWEDDVILAADRLTPGEIVQIDKNKIRGILLKEGSVHSHGAVLARSLGIPALTGIFPDKQWEGKQAIIKGERQGELALEPTEQELKRWEEQKREREERERLFQQLKGKDDITPGGRRIALYANIVRAEETAEVLANDGAGIGLFRSEFLFLDRRDAPGEEEQFQIYRQTAENMAGRPVMIRTVDLGTDKRWIGADPIREENPVMGYRGIRYSLDHPEIFRPQLRAIFRAAAFGDIGILYPLITSMNEWWKIKKEAEAVKAELSAQDVECPDIPQGIMIETPAAALMSDAFAPEVDFFMIGTHDLVQYVLAADRQNPKVENVYDIHHPAILRLLRRIIENGHQGGCQVYICGELCEDPEWAGLLLKMGIDGFSVPPSHILPMRQRIREAREE